MRRQFYTGRRHNIEHLLSDPHFEVMRCDITMPLYIEVDEIYNLVCPASPIHYQFDPVQTALWSDIIVLRGFKWLSDDY